MTAVIVVSFHAPRWDDLSPLGTGWTVITRYYRELLTFCLRKVKDHETAADLAQESYLRVLSMQQAGQAVLNPRALLKRVAMNAKIDLDRRAEIRQHEDIDALDEASLPTLSQHLQPEDICAALQVEEAYLKAIEALPDRCREAFCLYVFDELPNKQIAEKMGISLSMVNQHISRGKLACAACREALKGQRDDA